MSDTGFIYTYWKKQQQLFNKYFIVFKKYPETEAVREIRTTVKKFRAAFRLYLLFTEEKIDKYPLTVTEDFFAVLGIQRDIEVSLELLRNFEKKLIRTHPETKRCLRAILAISRNWTSKAVRKFKKKELVIVARLLKNGSAGGTEGSKDKLRDIIETSLADSKNYFKEPHLLRQHLKEIYYWIKMGQESLSMEFEYTEELQKILNGFGDWRNIQVFHARTRHIRKDYLPKSYKEYESIKIIEKDSKEMAGQLLKTTLTKTRQLLKKIDPEKNKKVAHLIKTTNKKT